MPIRLALLCGALLFAAAVSAFAEAAAPRPAPPATPSPAIEEPTAQVLSLAVVEFESHLDNVDELRKGAFRSSHASTVIRNTAAEAAPFLDVLPSQEVEARLEELIAAGKNTGTGSGNVLRVARAMRTDMVLLCELTTISDGGASTPPLTAGDGLKASGSAATGYTLSRR